MKTRYILEFQLIPKLVGLFNNRKAELFKVIEPKVWGQLLLKMGMNDFSSRDYKSSYMKDDRGNYYILIECPEPQLPTQVKYMVFVVRGATLLNLNAMEGRMEYFTLEKSFGFYAVCSPEEDGHSNCGSMDGEPTAIEFLERISSGGRLKSVEFECVPSHNQNNLTWLRILMIVLAIVVTVVAIAII